MARLLIEGMVTSLESEYEGIPYCLLHTISTPNQPSTCGECLLEDKSYATSIISKLKSFDHNALEQFLTLTPALPRSHEHSLLKRDGRDSESASGLPKAVLTND